MPLPRTAEADALSCTPQAQKQQALYRDEGVVPQFYALPAPEVSVLASQMRRLASIHGQRRRTGATSIDGNHLTRDRTLMGLYEWMIPIAAQVTGRPVITSPFRQYAMAVNLYDGPGCEHAWHVETNSLSAVLHLAEGHGACLEYHRPGQPLGSGVALRHVPVVGDVSLVRGKDVWHRVPPFDATVEKPCVVVVFNYYHPDDLEAGGRRRPPGL